VIPHLFNGGGFGPPRGRTRASASPWLDHPASGLAHATGTPYSDSLSLPPPHPRYPRHTPLTRRLILQKARRHLAHRNVPQLRRVVGRWFQVLFHSPPGVLFTFPSRYLSAIGHQGVFSLTRWSWQIHGRFPGSAATREHVQQIEHFHLPGYHRLRRPFPETSASTRLCHCSIRCQPDPHGPTTPRTQPLTGIPRTRFRLLRFRSPLLTESRLFSLPAGTEMFHFPAFPPHTLCVQVRVTPHDWCRVSPFGHPGITARLTAPPGLSRPPTSFIGSWCQGIHHPPSAT